MDYNLLMQVIVSEANNANLKLNQEIGHMDYIKKRKNGYKFNFSEHVRGMIYSFLTNQRPWYKIVPQLSKIDDLFFYYDYNKILKKNPHYYVDGIRSLKCGNLAIHKQMASFESNINRLIEIKKMHGDLDEFVTSDTPYNIAKKLASEKKYKIKYFGIALALEYLRNVGIDAIKPDVHIKRILSSHRLGICCSKNPTEKEAVNAISVISSKTGYSVSEIDAYLWMYCAKGYLDICNAKPKCTLCALRELCLNSNSSLQN